MLLARSSRRLALSTRRLPRQGLKRITAPLSTQGLQAPPTGSPAVSAAAGAAPPTGEPPDNRPWPIRWWKSLVFWSFLAAWAYSLVQQNRSRNALEQEEEEVRSKAPVNADEILELRALNDVSTEQLMRLQEVAREVAGCDEATLPQLLVSLTQTVGKPIREECAIERMLLALHELRSHTDQQAPGEPASPAAVPISLVASALAFLSNGPVSERLDSLFLATVGGDRSTADSALNTASVNDTASATETASAKAFLQVLSVLTATGQVPPEKQVALDQVGTNALGLDRSWYVQQPAVTYSAAELADAAVTELAAEGKPVPPSWYQFWRWGEERAVADAGRAAAGDAPGASNGGGLQERLDRELFGRLLVSNSICLWGECHLIAERKRIQRRREEARLAEATPPPAWHFWKWGSAGKGGETA
eukprot:scaffold9973_cov125-Isochrysis_galbana.AAC.7